MSAGDGADSVHTVHQTIGGVVRGAQDAVTPRIGGGADLACQSGQRRIGERASGRNGLGVAGAGSDIAIGVIAELAQCANPVNSIDLAVGLVVGDADIAV